ncbi:uncharacterized protein L201_004261 [Kwoniella dendrophila CBS 6074]|uniref:Uncharacterized protein n=1 Tax=Kwoniella dendrophila CBS 6074 TaxID=1295534 RepID=A0AAX4JXT2_9TREE
MTLPLTLKKSFSRSRKSLSSSPSSTSLSERSSEPPFDLSILITQTSPDNFELTGQSNLKGKEKENNKKEQSHTQSHTYTQRKGSIKFKLNDNSLIYQERRMPSKLLRGRNTPMTQNEENEQSDHPQFAMNDTQNTLLPSPMIHSSFPKSPYPFLALPSYSSSNTPAPTETRISPPFHNMRAIKQSHRRSRSFSDLITSSSALSMDQPWRDRETWLAIHNTSSKQQSPFSENNITQRKSSVPIDLESGGWRGRGGGTFFGADTSMNGPYPSFRVRVKPLTPPNNHSSPSSSDGEKGQSKVQSPIQTHYPGKDIYNQSSGILTPEQSPKRIYHQQIQSTWNIGNRNSESSSSSSSSDDRPSFTLKYRSPLENEDDEDLLPPLLPTSRTITRSSSFCSLSRNTTPIPWAHQNGNGSGRNSPIKQQMASSPKTATKQDNDDKSKIFKSPVREGEGDMTPKTWRRNNPSPPTSAKTRYFSSSTSQSPNPNINSNTPKTPETPSKSKSLSKAFGGFRSPKTKMSTDDDNDHIPITPTSPFRGLTLEDEEHKVGDDHAHLSPSKKLWRALKLVSPGKDEHKRFAVRRSSMDQSPDQVSPSKKHGWF